MLRELQGHIMPICRLVGFATSVDTPLAVAALSKLGWDYAQATVRSEGDRSPTYEYIQ